MLDVSPDDDGLVQKATIQIGTKKLGKEGQRLSNPSNIECSIHKLVMLVETN